MSRVTSVDECPRRGLHDPAADPHPVGRGSPRCVGARGAGSWAQRLGITTRNRYRLIDQGQLTGYRFGRVIRLKAEDVEGLI